MSNYMKKYKQHHKLENISSNNYHDSVFNKHLFLSATSKHLTLSMRNIASQWKIKSEN